MLIKGFDVVVVVVVMLIRLILVPIFTLVKKVSNIFIHETKILAIVYIVL
jgi:hypothetical protein